MTYWHVLRETLNEWNADKAPQLAASTAYFTVFSLAPLLVISMAIAGLVFDADTVKGEVLRQLTDLIGKDGAATIDSMITASHQSPHTLAAAIIGFVVLIVGASGLMAALQDAMNTIWHVKPKKNAGFWITVVLKRIFSIAMILSIGFVLLVSLAATSLVSLLVDSFSDRLLFLKSALPLLDGTLSLLIITLLFGLLLKFVPDIRLPWKNVWLGAFLTAALFTIGKFLLGVYLGQQNFTEAYGVGGSLIVLLLWVNYSAQILFLGVEFVKVSARESGVKIFPKAFAEQK